VARWRGTTFEQAEEVSPDDFFGDLETWRPRLVVVEGFSLAGPRYGREKAKQAVETIKMIGGVEALAVVFGYQVVEQQPSVRQVAQRSPFWTELVREHPLTGNSHVRSATAHGVYFKSFTPRGRVFCEGA